MSVMLKETPKKKTTLSEKVDGFIGFFSPRAEAHRKAYRQASKLAFSSSYKGAKKNRLNSDWVPGGGSADEDLLSALPELRERSRDLNRNNGIAAGITATMTTNVIGAGIKPQSRVDRESLGIDDKAADKFQKRAERVWEKWLPYADSTERMNFYEIQKLVDRQILENGEAIILPLRLKDKNRPYKLALEVIESDRLATPSDKRGDKSIRDGVEIGERGQPIAYYIRKTHPGDMALRLRTPNAKEFTRIPARNKLGMPNVFHLYFVLRPGQTRGVPFFAPVMTMFKDLASYMEATLVTARIAACFSVFIKSVGSPYGAAYNAADKTNASGQRIEEIEPGLVNYLAAGEEATSLKPEQPTGMFDPFVNRMMRSIGSSLELPYEVSAKDFSKTNYSSARAALLEARRYFQCRQGFHSARFCQPTWELLLEEAFLNGELQIKNFYEKRLDWVKTKWIAPGWSWVDPLKEVKAAKEAIESNISSLADIAASQGKDWEEILEQRAREENKRKELGLTNPETNLENDKEIDQIIKDGDEEEKDGK